MCVDEFCEESKLNFEILHHVKGLFTLEMVSQNLRS